MHDGGNQSVKHLYIAYVVCNSQCFLVHNSALFIYLFGSLLSFKVLNSIVLLGKAHQYILQNRQSTTSTKTREPTVVVAAGDVKYVSKDDMHLLASPRSSPLGFAGSDSPTIRRTQSLSEFGKEELLVATIETPSSCDGSLGDLSAEMTRQSSFGVDALLSNSTVSLVSVKLNSSFIEDRMAAEAMQGCVSPGGKVLDSSTIEVNVRKRLTSEHGNDHEETQTPLSEVNRYTMCSNRII